MIFFLLSTIVLLAVGYCLLALLRISQKHLGADLALSWFIGTGYFAFAYMLVVFVFQVGFNVIASLIIIVLPLAAFGMWRPKQKNAEQTKVSYLPATKRVLYLALIAWIVAILPLIFLHSKNTPTNTDDGVRLRAYTPFLVYQNDFRDETDGLILGNGIMPSFVPALSWQLGGGADHFHINYFVFSSFFFFLLLLYMVPTTRGNAAQGIMNVFLVLSIPLLLYHATTTYMDIIYILPFVLGFVFFSYYVQDLKLSDLKLTILFWTLTCFSKTEGEILALTGFAFLVLFVCYNYFKNKKGLNKQMGVWVLPVVIYFIVKDQYAGNISGLLNILTSVGGDMQTGDIAGTEAVVEKAKFTSEQVWRTFSHSFLASGNFGILFYVLLFNIAYFVRSIFGSRLIWSFLILGAIFFEIYYNGVVLHPEWTINQTTIHRSVIVLAVLASVFLSMLWTREREKVEVEGE